MRGPAQTDSTGLGRHALLPGIFAGNRTYTLSTAQLSEELSGIVLIVTR